MERPSYERLARLDESFLAFESSTTTMHVAMLCVFEGGSLVRARGGLDTRQIKLHLASRLDDVPRYRQCLSRIPLLDQLVWVDDQQFDLDCHVRHASLPRPGTPRQLQRLCARILERPLDRGRPLWEIWMIEGLPSGRFALFAKVHHCMVDGVAGVGLLAALLSPAPHALVRRVGRWRPKVPPRPGEMARQELLRRTGVSLRLAAGVGAAVQAPRTTASSLARRVSALWRMVGDGASSAPPTPFNEKIGSHRRVDWLTVDLADVKAVKRNLGGTVNDVVLATVAGAVRKFLGRRNAPLPANFRTVVPVDVRSTDEKDGLGNRVSAWILSLPIRTADAGRRLADVRTETERLKANDEASGAAMLTQAADWTASSVIRAAASLLNRAHVYNLIVTNVPGPQLPLHLLDARMVAAHPYAPLFHDQGVGIALFSYDGNLHWGLIADWDLMPDLHLFRDDLASSFEELCNTAGVRDKADPPVEAKTPDTARNTRHSSRREHRNRSGAEPHASA